MLTIFSAMRPFRGDIGDVQLNAIKSWLKIVPVCEVILFDDEEGTTNAATKGLSVNVIKDVRRSKLGAPLLNDLFRIAREVASGEVLAYNTADVILPNDFSDKVAIVHQKMFGRVYLGVASRIDMLKTLKINFDSPSWFDEVRMASLRYGVPHRHSAADLWVYPKSFNMLPPPFPIGRHLTDGWAIFNARINRVPVIDLTSEIRIIHQLHNRSSKKSEEFLNEQIECVNLFPGAEFNALSVIDSDWVFKNGSIGRPIGFRWLHSRLSLNYLYRWFVGQRRKRLLPKFYRR
jgi:hypothetical protein